ncbi:cation:proton antiporter [Luteimicrobium subarcticum]|uniref:CPA1 family monovalent cation:H+ antiporter n=1 Tax=Luteimicrobium subarcticum TaxID=620910 RepID=A0A2M8WRP0_9MICO|nr:cation:proton antiporter [Luteimicrobium subarcticum]PJI93605.1 CPA1 family monovalent cation:H+ antiporter [Luteimicrobium subarcticum]
MNLALAIVLGALAVIGVTASSRRLGVAAPLVLVLLGVGVSFLPFVDAVEIEPELILGGVLPPLLYSASVSMPVMDFRRDFKLIGALSVILVVVTAVVVGFLLSWVLDVGLATGIALAAVVSPTDAVATSIVKKLGVSPRIVTILEGESLLNDASSLVVLRSAVAAMAASVSFAHVAWDFGRAVVIAVVIGAIVGRLSLMLRARLRDPVLMTASSFVVPFVAYLPTEKLDASGLVAVVVAGIIAGQGAAKYLPPAARRSEEANWRTVEALLEGGVFLVMGLELYGLVQEVRDEHGSLVTATWVALLALVAVVLVRALYLWPMVVGLRRDREEMSGQRERLARVQEHLGSGTTTPEDMMTVRRDGREPPSDPRRRDVRRAAEEVDGTTQAVEGADPSDAPTFGDGAAHDMETLRPRWSKKKVGRRTARQVERKKRRVEQYDALDPQAKAAHTTRVQRFVDRRLADIDYLSAEPMGWRQGTVLAWAGMRGVVTVAAAQTLPIHAPGQPGYDRPLLVLIAFGVAAGSLMLQGGTLGPLVRRLGLAGRDDGSTYAERSQIHAELARAAFEDLGRDDLVRPDGSPYDPDVVDAVRQRAGATADRVSTEQDEAAEDVREQYRELRIEVLRAQRDELLRIRDVGAYSSESLREMLAILDADEISVELRAPSAEE